MSQYLVEEVHYRHGDEDSRSRPSSRYWMQKNVQPLDAEERTAAEKKLHEDGIWGLYVDLT